MSNPSKICVMGLGYIGLPTAALLASKGFDVHGVDVSENVVETINRGDVHIVEPDLDAVVKAAANSGKLKASLQPAEADIFMIAVPTPFKDGYVPDISYVEAAARSIAPYIRTGNAVILESTSPVGTTERIAEVLRESGVKTDGIHITHCPERVLPGQIMRELTENDRIVGGLEDAGAEYVADFYRSFVTGEVLVTDARTAEMSKLTENSFRDVNIAFANELSVLCDKFDIDVWELIRLANRHPRVNILQPGTGVGGHCIAVDPWFIVHAAQGDARLIQTAREVNVRKTEWVVERIIEEGERFYQRHGRAPIYACMGLAFKPNIDDLRESPALQVYHALVLAGKSVLAVEPNLTEHDSIKLTSYEQALEQADIHLYLVAHQAFGDIKPLTDDKNARVSLDFCGVSR